MEMINFNKEAQQKGKERWKDNELTDKLAKNSVFWIPYKSSNDKFSMNGGGRGCLFRKNYCAMLKYCIAFSDHSY